MNKEFNLEEAEEFIDNIYQHKFDDMEEILEDGTKVVHLGGLDDIKFTDFESASFTLLRGEQRLKHQVKKQKEVIDKAVEYITSYESISTIQGLTHAEDNKQLDEKTMAEMTNRYLLVHDKLLQILEEEKNMDKVEIDNIMFNNFLKSVPTMVVDTKDRKTISAYGSIDVDDLKSAIDRFDKVPDYGELLRENKNQKEVIDKITLIIKGTAYGGSEDYYIGKMKEILQIL